jgi:hypothetical protein
VAVVPAVRVVPVVPAVPEVPEVPAEEREFTEEESSPLPLLPPRLREEEAG